MSNYKLSKLSFLLATSAPTDIAVFPLLLLLFFSRFSSFPCNNHDRARRRASQPSTETCASLAASGDADKGMTAAVREDVQW